MSGFGYVLGSSVLDEVREVLDDGSGAEELAHWTCCEDEDVALCGADLTNSEWDEVEEPEDDDCPPCIATLSRVYDGECSTLLCPVSAIRSLKGTS